MINRYAVQEGQGLLRLTNASMSLSYSLSGDGTMKGNDGTNGSGMGSGATAAYQRIYYHPITGEYIPGGWVYYMNPNVPWSLNMSYSFSYNKAYQFSNGQKITKNNFTQTVNHSGNVKLTPRMSLNSLQEHTTFTASTSMFRGFLRDSGSRGVSEFRQMQLLWQTFCDSRRAAASGIMHIDKISG